MNLSGRLLGALLVAAIVAVILATRGDAHQPPRSVKSAVCLTFGPYCAQALRVAWCESRWSVYARNGQYLGLFQMGSYARARFGHSWTALGQAQAAYGYFRASGYRWTPWTCKP